MILSDFSGLSQEEAALITDVLSRLSLSHTPSAPLQSDADVNPLRSSSILELDLAMGRIEQELRGLQVPGQKVSRPPGPVGTAYGPSSSEFSGAVRRGAPFPVGVTNAPHTAEPFQAQRGPALAAREEFPPSGPIESSSLFGFHSAVQTGSLLMGSFPGPEPTSSVQLRDHMRDATGHVEDVPGRPASAQPRQSTSVLQEMRERLRQQQRQAAAEPPNASAELSADIGAGAGVRGSFGPVGPIRAPTPAEPRTSTEGQAVRSSNGPGTISASPAKSRRSLPQSPAAAAKAFTMLNARTSVERYGPEPGQEEPQAGTPSKAPVKLPEQERSARLQQLYERTLQWRRRCDERYAKARHERENMELEGCTFTPKITTASNLIVQGKSPSEVYQEISKWGTPTKHQQAPSPHRGISPSGRSSVQATPVRTAVAADRGPRSPHPAAATAGGRGSLSPAPRSPCHHGSGFYGVSAAVPPSPAPTNVSSSADVAERLYQRAFQLRARQEERLYQQLLEEERQRRFTASQQGVMPRVYNPPEQPAARHLPTGMEECTFHPRRAFEDSEARPRRGGEQHSQHRSTPEPSPSRLRSHSGKNWPDAADPHHASAQSPTAVARSRPKSAPHIRSGAGGRQASPQPSRYVDAPSPSVVGQEASRGQRARSVSRGPPSTHTTVSISPDLDWDEFLARQERFLQSREYKMQLLEQVDPAGPRMSPGSKKLLRERAARQNPGRAEGSGGEGDAGGQQAGGGGFPGRRDRRVQTIMDMYKECTFQPQITRRAAALPSRNVDEMVDGGRARREEWIEQQRALQQIREVEGATFKPQIPANPYSHVRPRISLKNPDAYLAHVADKQRQREALRAELEDEREAIELQQCTFKPQVTPLPAYLIRRLQEQQLRQEEEEEQEQYGPQDGGTSVAWEEGEPDMAQDPGGLEETTEYDGYCGDSLDDPPSDYPSHAGTSDYASMMADEVSDIPHEAYRDAYQRALRYANHAKDL